MIRNEVVLNQFPRFISIKYQQLVECQDLSRQTCEAALHVFDRCLRFIAIYCTSQYLRWDRYKMRKYKLNSILDPNIKIGDLQILYEIIETTFKAYEENQENFFIPEMYALYWDTSDPNRRTEKRSLFEDIEKMIRFSNDLHNKNLLFDEHAWVERAAECVDILNRFLNELSFLKNYEILLIESKEAKYAAQLHKGLSIKPVEFDYEGSLRPGWIYISKERKHFLRLDPLIQKTRAEATAVYRELTNYARLKYLLLTSEIPEEEPSDSPVEEFFNLLVTIENVKKVTPTDPIGWSDLTSIAHDQNKKSLDALGDEFQHVYLQRNDVLDSFKEFMVQAPACFVLTGKSGSGKSSFAFSLIEELKNAPSICPIFISAPKLNEELDLNQAITETLYQSWGITYTPGEISIWDSINRITGMGDRRKVLLILDAVNEHSQPMKIFEQLFLLLEKKYKWLKILLTSRPETLELLGKNYNLAKVNKNEFFRLVGDENPNASNNVPLAACEILPFSMQELQDAYQKYEARFELKTSFSEIEKNLPEVMELIKDPFYLRILAEGHKGRIISGKFNQFTLIDKFIDGLCQPTIKRDQEFMEQDIAFIKEELVPLFFPAKDQLNSKPVINPLYETSKYCEELRNYGLYSSFKFVNPILRLSQINILRHWGNPDKKQVAFQHDKFLEYFLGAYLFKKMQETRTGWFGGDATQGYRELITSRLMDVPHFLGIVQNSLYKHLQDAVDNHKAVQVDFERLCVNSHPAVKLVVVPVLSAFSSEGGRSRDLVEEIVKHLAQIPITPKVRRNRETLNAVLSAREVALETAFHLADTGKMAAALLDRNAEVRELGIRYTYLLDRVLAQKAADPADTDQSQKSFEILHQVSLELRKHFIRNRHSFASFAQLSMVLLIEHMDEEFGEGKKKVLIPIILDTIRDIGRFRKKKKSFLDQAFQFLVKTLMLDFITALLKFWAAGNSFKRILEPVTAWFSGKQEDQEKIGRTSANYKEFSAYYRLPAKEREVAKQISNYMRLPLEKHGVLKDPQNYLDPETSPVYADVESILLQGFSQSNCMTTTFGNAIASAWGAIEPDRVEGLCEKVFASDCGNWEVALDASIIWYQSIKRQKYRDEDREKWDAWLNNGKALIRKIIDEGGAQLGYGRFRTPNGTYEQYPLLFYMALYNRVYPGSPNDLLDEYLARAKTMPPDEREKLLIYLADTLGDRRAYLTNYPPVISSFEPYIPKEEEKQNDFQVSKAFEDHLAASLAGVRGVFPNQIDHFLMSVGAKKAFTNQVIQESYGRQSTVISLRAADFVYDLLIYGDEHMRDILVQMARFLTHERSFTDALQKIGTYLVQELNKVS